MLQNAASGARSGRSVGEVYVSHRLSGLVSVCVCDMEDRQRAVLPTTDKGAPSGGHHECFAHTLSTRHSRMDAEMEYVCITPDKLKLMQPSRETTTSFGNKAAFVLLS